MKYVGGCILVGVEGGRQQGRGDGIGIGWLMMASYKATKAVILSRCRQQLYMQGV